MKSCAIVILNFNGEKILPVFLPSVVSESSSDIWVIDNASTDGSIALLQNDFPKVGLIQLSDNFGFAGGYNWGLEQLKGQYQNYILLNSDVEVTPSWDTKLNEALVAHPNYAALQPKILSWNKRSEFDYAGAGGGYLDDLGYPYCRGRIWNSIEIDKSQYDDFATVDWASGACMIIRSEVFHDLDGFDAHFFAHMEEIDLCWRIRSQGFQVGYIGEVEVYHQGGATLQRSSPNKLYLNIRNSLSMLYKNQSSGRFWLIFMLKGFLESIAALGYLITGKASSGKAVFKGYRDFLSRRKLLVKAKSSQEVKSMGPSKVIFWDYFFRKKKTFGKL
ncbi:glycosyltransferase family 2 protein [Algoriphagus namhaensis]|uniref:Glycosyltransferase family 2 protein n=1 Tax=Algoriphagus namhaensis TaxID=915353 RepID=A0ABV8APF0_9BACT